MSNSIRKFIVGLFLFSLLPGLSTLVQGQRKAGGWQEFLSYRNALKVVEGENQIFCATGGGLFYRDLSDNSLTKITGRDGLTGQTIQTIGYHQALDMLMVVYTNSNIDLVFRREVVNMGDIFRKQIAGSKTINNIHFYGNEVFLACDFGIVAINLQRREITGTYLIGEEGTQIAVFDVAVFDQSIYAATGNGLMVADLNSQNLLDFRSWSRVNTIPRADNKFSHLEVFNGELLAVYTRDAWDGDEIFVLRNGTWERTFHQVNAVNDLQVKHNYLIVTGKAEVHIFDSGSNLVGHILQYNLESTGSGLLNTRSATISRDGRIWIADYTDGLIEISGQQFSQNLPTGPLNNSIFNLSIASRSLWVAAGGRTDPWNNQFQRPLFQEFDGNSWIYYSQKEVPEMTGFWDIVQVLENPADPGHIFVASWGGGVIEFKNRQFVQRYNNLNSPLETALPGLPDEPYTRIGGMAFDNKNHLWITNSQSSKGLHELSPDGNWRSFELPQVAGFQYTIGQVIVTQRNDKWVVIPRGNDVYVINADGTQTRHLPVTSYFNNGKVEIINRMNDVYSIAEDLNGDIWIGTSKGIAVFAGPSRVWQNETYYAYQPSLDLGDAVYHPLLETETITSIVVDGGNRKWLGTKSSGLYLVSERGDREILHFTTDNSPLLSNTITSLALNEATGELFIGTDAGLISYQGDAPVGVDSFADVYVYPNPVRETYHGPVVIKGLKRDTDIRITDIAGNLVHKTKSLGSQAVWDGKNLNGRRVSTGVYLIFAVDSTGDETHVAKLLFIR